MTEPTHVVSTAAAPAVPDPQGEVPRRSPVLRWLIAVAAAGVAAGVREALSTVVREPVAWIMAYPAVVLISLRLGFGPGVLTAALCGLGASLLGSSPALPTADLAAQWGLYGTAAIVIALACSQSPRSRRTASVALSDAAMATRVDTPLTRWLQAVLWGAATIPLILFACAAWWGRVEAVTTAEERVSRTNGVALRHAERVFATARELLLKARDLAAQPDEQLRASGDEVRQRLQDMMLGTTVVQAITFWDADGRSIVSTMLNPAIARANIADRPYFEQARQAGDAMFISEPIKGRVTGGTVVNAVARRTTADGRFAGVVVVSLFPQYFQDFYQSLASAETGLSTFAMFDAGGTVLARWPPAAGQLRVPPDSKLKLATLAGDDQGIVRLVSRHDGKPRMISFMRVPGLPIYTSAALDEQAIFEPWHRFVALLAGVLGPLTAGLVYVSWLALKKTRREQVVLLELQAQMRRRAQTEKALAQAQRLEALSVLTGGVAHDFNNLLAIVNGNLHMIRRHHPEVGGGRHLGAISRAVASGVRLTRQLLSFARRQALTPEQIVLQTWLPGMADLLQSTVGHGVALRIDVAPDAPPIRVDAGEFELALINLATNAKDAMDEQGALRLEVASEPVDGTGSESGRRVVLRVSDTGSGIAPDLLAKVFEPFFTTKAPNKGTGLGLSQVYGFCLQSGGTARVDSELGHGTTVTLSFPSDAGALPAADAASAPKPMRRLSGRVLLVEDNVDVAAANRELLEAVGITVDCAASGEDALALLERAGPRHDLVLSDIAMPGAVDGLQLAVKLKASRPSLPVLLVTGYAARLDDARDLGCRVLAKPVDPDLLVGEIAKILEAEPIFG